MPTSGSVDFSINRDEIITAAMRGARCLGQDQVPIAFDITTCGLLLNLLVKQWQGRADFGANLKVFARKTAYLFLQKDQGVYSVGPSGDHWTASYSSTTLAAAKNASATSITLASAIGANADNIGIELSSGAIGWTTISAGGGTTSLTLPANSLGAAASGARVFTYTSKARRPLGLLTGVLRTTDNQDSPLLVDRRRQDYEAIPDKTASGIASWLAYEATMTNGTIYADVTPSDVTRVVRVVFLGAPEDFDAITDTPDYPQEWYRPLVGQLSIDIAPTYGVPVTAEMLRYRDEAISIAQNTDPETTDQFFEPGKD